MYVVAVIGLVFIILLGIISKLLKARASSDTTIRGSLATPPGATMQQTDRTTREEETTIHAEPVTILETYDSAELLVAKSLLEAAEIPYYARGEAVQDLIGSRLWGGSNFAIGPVALQVPAELAEEARALLEDQNGPA